MSEATAHNPEDYKVVKGNILGGVEIHTLRNLNGARLLIQLDFVWF